MFPPRSKEHEPDAIAKPPLFQKDEEQTPWQKEWEERKLPGKGPATWKPRKSPKKSYRVVDEDTDDAAALFFASGGDDGQSSTGMKTDNFEVESETSSEGGGNTTVNDEYETSSEESEQVKSSRSSGHIGQTKRNGSDGQTIQGEVTVLGEDVGRETRESQTDSDDEAAEYKMNERNREYKIDDENELLEASNDDVRHHDESKELFKSTGKKNPSDSVTISSSTSLSSEDSTWANPNRSIDQKRRKILEIELRLNDDSVKSQSIPTHKIDYFADQSSKRHGDASLATSEVYRTCIPDPSQNTDLYDHQNSKSSPSQSLDTSTEATEAMVSNVNVVVQERTTSVSDPSTDSYTDEKAKHCKYLFTVSPSPTKGQSKSRATSVATSGESETLKWKPFKFLERRLSYPWVPGHEYSFSTGTSIESSVDNDARKSSPYRNPKNNIIKSNRGRISFNMDPQVKLYTPVKETCEKDSKSTRHQGNGAYLLFFFCVFAIPSGAAISLLFVNTTDGDVDRSPLSDITEPDGSNRHVESSPTTLPFDPTMMPTFQPVSEDLIFRLLGRNSADSGQALRDRSSPQFAAMQWLRTPKGHRGVSNNEKFLQRYALASIFYSTRGSLWTSNDWWLTGEDECKWFSAEDRYPCDEQGSYIMIHLENNRLHGTLPPEVDLLYKLGKVKVLFIQLCFCFVVSYFFHLESINLANNRNLSGSLPESLESLDFLTEILIEDTSFVSPLPHGICNSSFDEFWADCDKIGGCDCCTECFY
jgi:hypothetical protein